VNSSEQGERARETRFKNLPLAEHAELAERTLKGVKTRKKVCISQCSL
jgi:hypothetical protein